MERYHGECELDVIEGDRLLNYYCKTHQILCGSSKWELGWHGGTCSKKIWGQKYKSKSWAVKQ